MPGIAEKERRARDLRSQVAELEPGLEGVIFEHIRTRRELITVYSMKDGEAIPVPEYMLRAVLTKMDGGEYMFTDNPAEAPEYHKGTVKCFLHADSPERASGVLNEIGLAGKVCPAGSLASVHSKRTHGERRHGREWAAYKEYLDNEKEEKAITRQEKQLEATLALARGTAEQAASYEGEPARVLDPKTACDICGKGGLKNVGAHKRGAHNERP
jgi:hypothetical protein